MRPYHSAAAGRARRELVRKCAALLVLLLALAVLMKASQWSMRERQEARHAVVFDAGSTGSRVHVYRFLADPAEGTLVLDKELLFTTVTPGLSGHAAASRASPAEAAEEAARSLDPLVDAAKAAIPVEHHATTTVELRATAGLRLLKPPMLADAVLDAARAHLLASFSGMHVQGVTILDGEDEAAFLWVAINLLLNKLGGGRGGDRIPTVATVDLGGGSVQLAYETNTTFGDNNSSYVKTLAGGTKLYVHSFLNYGLMAGRKEVLLAGRHSSPPADVDDASAVAVVSACMQTSSQTQQYVYNGQRILAEPNAATPAAASEEAGASCRADARRAFREDAACTTPPPPSESSSSGSCNLDGQWTGPGHASEVFAASYVYDIAQAIGLLGNPEVAPPLAPVRGFTSELVKASDAYCDGDRVDSHAPTNHPSNMLCLDTSYVAALLTQFGVDPAATVTVVKRIPYKGREIEAQWALGAALNSLMSSSARR